MVLDGRVRLVLALAVLTLIGLAQAGCNGESGKDYRLEVSASVPVVAGREATGTITVTRIDPDADSFLVGLSVSGCPAGATCRFNHAQMSLPPLGGALKNVSASLIIQTQGSLASGTYPLTITSNGAGIARAATMTLTVTDAPAFDVTSVTPGLQIFDAGGTVTYTVTLTQHSGTAGVVALSASGCPAGTTCTFAPAAVTPTAAGATSTLTVATTLATPVGQQTLTISAAGQGLTRTETVLASVRVPSDVVGQVTLKGRTVPISLTGSLCRFVGTACRYDVYADCPPCRRYVVGTSFASVNDLEEAIAQVLNQASVSRYTEVVGGAGTCPCTGGCLIYGVGLTPCTCSCQPVCFSVEPHR